MKNKSPASFAKYVSGGSWIFAKHLKLINTEILKIINGKNDKLIVNLPPRHGKSEFISKYFPAWYLCTNPDSRIILTAYESSFAAFWGRQVRDIISMHGDEFGIKLDKSSRAANEFHIAEHNGSMLCVGAGGPITGRGADLIIIDDPVKNAAEANSAVIRDNIWEWFRSTVYTRLEPKGAIILIMTRWHEDDLCGRIFNSSESSKWSRIILKAISEENDMLERKPGMALWSKRYNLQKLNEIKSAIGSYWFSALYQQSPAQSQGNVFKRENFRYFSIEGDKYVLNSGKDKYILIKNLPVMCTVDLAASVSEMSDYTCILTFSVTKNNEILVLDVLTEKFETTRHYNLLLSHFHKWNPVLIGIESVQYQISLVKSLSEKGIPVKPLKATTDKVSRALGIAAKMELGEVYFLKDAEWLHNFEKELLEFPKAKHDDMVDAFSYITRLNISGQMKMPKFLKKKSILERF